MLFFLAWLVLCAANAMIRAANFKGAGIMKTTNFLAALFASTALAACADTGDQPASQPSDPAASETPVTEPAAEQPVAEEPAAVEPAAEEPVAEEPVAEEPVAEEPAAEEPAGETPPAGGGE